MSAPIGQLALEAPGLIGNPEIPVVADRAELDYLFMDNGYYTKGGYGGYRRIARPALKQTRTRSC